LLLNRFPIKNTNRVFYTMFVFFILSMLVPAIVIGTLSISHSTNNIVAQVSQSNADIQREKMDMLEIRFEGMYNITNQIASNSNIWALVRSTGETVQNRFKIAEIIDYLDNIVASDKLIQSVYIFDKTLSFVISNTWYNNEDFPDKEILELNFTGNACIIPRRFENKDIVSYVRKYDDVFSSNELFCVVNMDRNMLLANLVLGYQQFEADAFLIDESGSVLFSKGNTKDGFIEYVKKVPESGYSIYKNNAGGFIVCKTNSDILNWTLVYTLPYSKLVQTVRLRNKIILTVIIVIVVLSFLLAYLFSMHLYKPLSRLLTEVKNRYGIKTPGLKDDYKIIDDALKKLFERGNEYSSKYQMAFPYFMHHSIIDLLTDNSFDADKYARILNLLDICFTHNNFMVALIDLENANLTVDLRSSVETQLHVYGNAIVYVLTSLNYRRLAIIVNTDSGMEEVCSIFSGIKDKLEEEEINITVSLGRIYKSPENISNSYAEAIKQIDSKFFTGKNKVIYEHDVPASDEIKYFEKDLKDEFLNSIMAQNREQAVSLFERMSEKLINKTGAIEYAKYAYFEVVTEIVNTLNDVGIKFDEIGLAVKNINEIIKKAETEQELKEYVISLISKSIDLLENLLNRQHKDIVEKTVGYINKNYHIDLSLQDIAKSVFLSPRYLSSIFKYEQGITIYEYLTKCRMETAKDLILKHDMKVQEIAEAVGYNNTQSFLKTFKKFYRMTPMQYRRQSY